MEGSHQLRLVYVIDFQVILWKRLRKALEFFESFYYLMLFMKMTTCRLFIIKLLNDRF